MALLAVVALAGCTGTSGTDGTGVTDGAGGTDGDSAGADSAGGDNLVEYAAEFPAMAADVLALADGDLASVTFGSATPYNDLEYTLFDTDYIEGETAGYDTFLPADPASEAPGAGERRLLEVVSNPLIERAYGAPSGDRIILGLAGSGSPFFADTGEDDGYLVVRNLDFGHGTIELPGAAGDYGVVRAGPDDGAETDGWYLFWTAEEQPDLIAFVYPCDAGPDGPAGPPPSGAGPDSLTGGAAGALREVDLCGEDGRLDLDDPDQFRFLGTASDGTDGDASPAVPEGVVQFGTAGTEIVHGVTRDADGTTYVHGASAGTLTGAVEGDHAVFVSARAPDGGEVWTTEVALPDGALIFDAVTDAEHLYAVGRTFGALDGFTSAGTWDGFLLKLRLTDGEVVASDQWGNEGIDGYGSVTLDDSGHLYVAGAGSPQGQAGSGDNSFLLAKHRTDDLGNVWRVIEPVLADSTRVAEAWGGVTYIPGDTPGDGRVVAGGWFIDQPNAAQGFVAMWSDLTDENPTRIATQVIGDQRLQGDWVLDTAADAEGAVYAVGWTSGGLDGEQIGEGDAYIVKFDEDLSDPVFRQVGTERSDQYRRVEVGPDGTVYAVGYTYGDRHGDNADPDGRTGDIVVDAWTGDLEPVAAVQFGTAGEDRGWVAVDGDRVWVSAMTEAALAGPHAGAFDAALVVLHAADLEVTTP